MQMIIHVLYTGLLNLFSLPAAVFLRMTPRYRPLLGRFYWRNVSIPVAAQGGRIWIHAASLGEVNTAAPFIEALRERWPEKDVLLTVSTISGMEQARRLGVTNLIYWCPFDLPFSVRRFIDVASPSALILVETEIWPNMIHAVGRRFIPIAIVNGRLSEKHFGGYLRIRALIAPALKRVNLVCAQGEADAKRFSRLGTPHERIHVVGNSKFDGARRSLPADEVQRLIDRYRLDTPIPVLVFGSTRPGDEQRAVTLWHELRDLGNSVQLIIVPRHVSRCEEIRRELSNVEVILHSSISQSDATCALGTERVLLVDTLGELSHFYALADVAIIGGSFSMDVQGHNPIEAAALGIPTVFGPCMKNFRAPAQILVEAGAGLQLESAGQLSNCVAALLEDEPQRAIMASRARAAVETHSGAIHLTLAHLSSLLEQTPERLD